MKNLYDRLLWICHDQRVDTRYENKAIMKITGLSSGRVTQINQDGEKAKLSDETVSDLVRKGYLRDWIQNGTGPEKRAKQKDQESGLSEEAIRFGLLFDALHHDDQLGAWKHMKKFALECAISDDEYLANVVKILTKTT